MKQAPNEISASMSVVMGDKTRTMQTGDAALIFRKTGEMELIVSASKDDDVEGKIPPRVFAIVLGDIISQETGVWPQLWDMAFKATTARLMKEKMDAAGVSSN